MSQKPKETFTQIITKRREPNRYLLWMGIGGIAFLFFVLTALYLARKGRPGWTDFHLPFVFYISTVLILLSSYTLWRADQSFKKEQFKAYTRLTGLTLFLGCAFIISQFLGWKELVTGGVHMKNSISGAFVYILSGLHVAHILGGLVFLYIAFMKALKNRTYVDAFVYSVNPPNQLRLSLISVYWHFVDILWLYLFAFFLINHW
ncbi:MAG: cytochrome c oxidase subunit 3 [Verrucomicrobia bacterium]|nr:cytochrome c oxidase subunit 3 [Cytophagales bacterium]